MGVCKHATINALHQQIKHLGVKSFDKGYSYTNALYQKP